MNDVEEHLQTREAASDAFLDGDVAPLVAVSVRSGSASMRLTELFRREDGEWRLFHRHADPLTE